MVLVGPGNRVGSALVNGLSAIAAGQRRAARERPPCARGGRARSVTQESFRARACCSARTTRSGVMGNSKTRTPMASAGAVSISGHFGARLSPSGWMPLMARSHVRSWPGLFTVRLVIGRPYLAEDGRSLTAQSPITKHQPPATVTAGWVTTSSATFFNDSSIRQSSMKGSNSCSVGLATLRARDTGCERADERERHGQGSLQLLPPVAAPGAAWVNGGDRRRRHGLVHGSISQHGRAPPRVRLPGGAARSARGAIGILSADLAPVHGHLRRAVL